MRCDKDEVVWRTMYNKKKLFIEGTTKTKNYNTSDGFQFIKGFVRLLVIIFNTLI